MKFPHSIFLALGMVLLFSTFANAQNPEPSIEKSSNEKSSFDKITVLSTAAAVGLTIANVEGSHRAIRTGKACEKSFLVQASDGCSISRTKAYGFGLSAIATTLLIQKFKPEWKKPLEGARFSLAAGNGIGWAVSMRF